METAPRKSLKTVLIRTYASILVSRLNEFVDGSGLVHTAQPVQVDSNCLIIVKALTMMAFPPTHPAKVKVIKFQEPPPQSADITYDDDEIRIYKPCATYEDLHGWSNVAAYLDADRIICEILSVRCDGGKP